MFSKLPFTSVRLLALLLGLSLGSVHLGGVSLGGVSLGGVSLGGVSLKASTLSNETTFPSEMETEEGKGAPSGSPEHFEKSLPQELTFEIKFSLEPQLVLGEDHLFTEDFAALFQLEEEYQPIEVLYLDTSEKELRAEGWINRIRRKSEKPKLERTYKKRYDITGEEIDSALEEAKGDGFQFQEGLFSPQVEWNYSDMQLSLSYTSSQKLPEIQALSELRLSEAIDFLSDDLPLQEKTWREKGWAVKVLERARLAGPLTFLRRKGTWEGIEVKAEIWPLPSSADPSQGDKTYLCEISAQLGEYEAARSFRESLMAYLEEQKILLPQSSEKTKVILDYYLG